MSTDNPTEKLTAMLERRVKLVQERAEVAKVLASIDCQLQALDAQLFPRVAAVAAAVDGTGGAIQQNTPEAPKFPRAADLLNALLPRAEFFAAPNAAPPSPAGVAITKQRLEVMAAKHRQARRERNQLQGPIVAVLTEAGRPLDRNEIYSALEAKGVQIGGQDPKANLSAHLSYMASSARSPIARSEDGKGWTVQRGEAMSTT